MKKKIISMFTICFMLCTLIAASVSAAEFVAASDTDAATIVPYATNYFTGSTGTMNTLAGTPSRIFNVSSGSTPENALVTNVTLNITVSRGSIPFYVVVKNPDGFWAERYVSASDSITFTEFKDKEPKGTWQIYIYNTGTDFTDVSTATARMTVTYQY